MNCARPVLSATDLSALSRHAAQRAAMPARDSGASMTLMHTVRGPAIDELRRWCARERAAAGAIARRSC